ncbi:MAG: FRG domain-containing protein [Chloroflexi bacterium]|nr:FRG domain-containing protein [Chloroflexota bacterium]
MDARTLRNRWLSSPDPRQDDRLLAKNRFDEGTAVWTVTSEIEMIRLLGALQWHNPRLKLWFRGETKYFPNALPKRLRVSSSDAALTSLGIAWLNSVAGRDRALRDRRSLARAAILQHYGCPTSLLDLSSSYDVACAFAFAAGDQAPAHLRVYAVPRHQHAVSVFDDADVVLVDLNAELPSYCARPHVQQAAFLARREAVCQDIEGAAPVDVELAEVDALCIAHILLKFSGAARFYEPRRSQGVLYPLAGTGCLTCGKAPDMNGDYLLHILSCYAEKFPNGKPDGFPDVLSSA